MAIDPKFIIQYKGKDYPTWPGILDGCHRAGVKEIGVKLLQFPTKENGGLAIAEATMVFTDGRIFTEIGDASAANCSPQIATACCRMAATRAKGRAGRDALNIGATMFEELPQDDTESPSSTPPRAARSGVARDAAPRAARPDAGANAAPAAPPSLPASFCVTCGVEVEEAVAQLAIKHFAAVYCVTHGRAELAAQRAAAEQGVGVSEEE